MTVGVLRIRLRLQASTLKEKRAVVKSAVERVRSRFNASCAEVDDLDAKQFATIGAVCVSNDGQHAEAMLQAIARYIEESRLDAEVVEVETELIAV